MLIWLRTNRQLDQVAGLYSASVRISEMVIQLQIELIIEVN